MELMEFKKLIEEHDRIVIYRHINPDYDACGAQNGLKHLIAHNYPQKTVLTYGTENIEDGFAQKMDNPQDVCDFLAVVLDTSTLQRCDDASFKNAKRTVKIDHHLKGEVFCDKEYVDSQSSSTCQIIAQFAIEAGWTINKQAAEFLYIGMMTDSQRFSIDKVNAQTFTILASLTQCGIDIPLLSRIAYDQSIEEYRAASYFRNRIVFDEGVAYLFVDEQDYANTALSKKKCKDFVDLMANIKEVDKYAVFALNEQGGYDISLRSHKPPVVHICQKYGGGGHALACGAKNIDLKQCEDVIGMLKDAK